MGEFSEWDFRIGTWPIPKGPKSPPDKTEEKAPQLLVEPAFGENEFYPDSYELYFILKNLTKLVSQQQVYLDEKTFSTQNESYR